MSESLIRGRYRIGCADLLGFFYWRVLTLNDWTIFLARTSLSFKNRLFACCIRIANGTPRSWTNALNGIRHIHMPESAMTIHHTISKQTRSLHHNIR